MSDFVSGAAIAEAKAVLSRVRANMGLNIKGKDDVIDQVLICLAAGDYTLTERNRDDIDFTDVAIVGQGADETTLSAHPLGASRKIRVIDGVVTLVDEDDG